MQSFRFFRWSRRRRRSPLRVDRRPTFRRLALQVSTVWENRPVCALRTLLVRLVAWCLLLARLRCKLTRTIRCGMRRFRRFWTSFRTTLSFRRRGTLETRPPRRTRTESTKGLLTWRIPRWPVGRRRSGRGWFWLTLGFRLAWVSLRRMLVFTRWTFRSRPNKFTR